MATDSPALPTRHDTSHTAAGHTMCSQSQPGQCVHQDPQLMRGQQQFPVQQVSVSETGSAGPSSRPSPSNSHSNSSVTVMPQGVAMHPSLDASALTREQSANQSEQQQWQVHAMSTIQGLMPWYVPNTMPSQYLQAYQQPSTVQLAVMQQTPPHLTSLRVPSVVGETFWPFLTGPAVRGDGGALDPPTQGAVQWVDIC